MRRILVVVQNFHEDKLGWYRRLANFLRGNPGWRFILPTHRSDGEWLRKDERWDSVQLAEIPRCWINRGPIWGWLRYIKEYSIRLMRDESPVSAVYLGAPSAWWVLPTIIVARRLGIPCILDMGDPAESTGSRTARPLLKCLERVLFSTYSCVLTASPDLARLGARTFLAGIGREFFQVGRHRLERKAPGSTQNHHIIYCGTYSQAQNLEAFIRAWGGITRRLPGARLTLLGRGENGDERHLRQLVERLGLKGHVSIGGPRSPESIPQLLAQADWGFVSLDSRNELAYAVPTKLLEYFASDLPVVAVGGERVRRIIDRSGGGVWLSPEYLGTHEGIEFAVSQLTHCRHLLARRAFDYPCVYLNQTTYQNGINIVIGNHVRRWSRTIEDASTWLKQKAVVSHTHVPPDMSAVRHFISPSRV
jgi:glycosyltransferase involved in cell wall biosynthesis